MSAHEQSNAGSVFIWGLVLCLLLAIVVYALG